MIAEKVNVRKMKKIPTKKWELSKKSLKKIGSEYHAYEK